MDRAACPSALQGMRAHERRHSCYHAERGLRRLPAYAAAQARRDQLAASRVRLLRHQAGEPVLQAHGARAQVRRQRDGDRDLRAGQGLRQAARSHACDHDGAVPARHHPVQRGAPAHAGRACRQTHRRSLLQPAVWVRGILENDYGVDLDKVRWVTFEDGHVAEYHEPQRVERAGADKNLLKMLRAGELDAAIYGADLPNDPTLKSLIPDAEAAAQRWYARHKVVPINHMVVVTEKLAKSDPQTVQEIYRLLLQAKTAAGLPKAGAIDFLPFGLEACRPALLTIITYALQQRLIPRKIEVEDLFDDTTRALES